MEKRWCTKNVLVATFLISLLILSMTFVAAKAVDSFVAPQTAEVNDGGFFSKISNFFSRIIQIFTGQSVDGTAKTSGDGYSTSAGEWCGDGFKDCECGDILVSQYIMTGDLDCTEIGVAEGITMDETAIGDIPVLDCNGHTILGSGQPVGVMIMGQSQGVITNCVIDGFDEGIHLESSANIQIYDNVLVNNVVGIFDMFGNMNQIMNNHISLFVGTGIWLVEANEIVVTGNTISSGSVGIMIDATIGLNHIDANLIENTDSGMVIMADMQEIQNNKVCGSVSEDFFIGGMDNYGDNFCDIIVGNEMNPDLTCDTDCASSSGYCRSNVECLAEDVCVDYLCVATGTEKCLADEECLPGNNECEFPVEEGPPVWCRGDMNQDGIIDNTDLGLFWGYFSQNDLRTDLNCDGSIDETDINLLYNNAWAECSEWPEPCDWCRADLNLDGIIDEIDEDIWWTYYPDLDCDGQITYDDVDFFDDFYLGVCSVYPGPCVYGTSGTSSSYTAKEGTLERPAVFDPQPWGIEGTLEFPDVFPEFQPVLLDISKELPSLSTSSSLGISAGDECGDGLKICECGDLIVRDYTMEDNLYCGGVIDGLTLVKPGITLDCANWGVINNNNDDDYYDYGIWISGNDYWGFQTPMASGVTVKNCDVQGWDAGIVSDTSEDNVIIDNNVENNWGKTSGGEYTVGYGIFSAYSINNYFSGNTIINNRLGFLTQFSSEDYVVDDTLCGNTWDLYIYASINTEGDNTCDTRKEVGDGTGNTIDCAVACPYFGGYCVSAEGVGPYCGDGNTDEGEQCDDANTNNNDGCIDCMFAYCGDGYLWTEQEYCDDGNQEDNDVCTTDCIPNVCGDGFEGGVLFEREWNLENEGLLYYPMGIAVDSDYVYTVGYDETLLRFDKGNEAAAYYSFSDTTLTTAQGIALDPFSETIYVADAANNRIALYNYGGDYTGEWGEPNYNFYWPLDIVSYDDYNNDHFVFVADTYNYVIKKFWSDGGSILEEWSVSGLIGGMAVDSLGNVYVGYFDNNFIEVFDKNGDYVNDFGGPGEGNGEFNEIWGMAIDSNDDLYVIDYNDRVQVFDNNGNFKYKFGTSGNGEFEFSQPEGIAVDSNGDMYIADAGNNRIQVYRVEDCDGGSDCNPDCTTRVAVCGDGIIQPENGEECDDGNTNNNDDCLDTCLDATCGDGLIWEGTEQCDDGNNNNNDACLNTCEIWICGDGYINPPEEDCDVGHERRADLTDCCDLHCNFEMPGTECDGLGYFCDIGGQCDDPYNTGCDNDPLCFNKFGPAAGCTATGYGIMSSSDIIDSTYDTSSSGEFSLSLIPGTTTVRVMLNIDEPIMAFELGLEVLSYGGDLKPVNLEVGAALTHITPGEGFAGGSIRDCAVPNELCDGIAFGAFLFSSNDELLTPGQHEIALIEFEGNGRSIIEGAFVPPMVTPKIILWPLGIDVPYSVNGLELFIESAEHCIIPYCGDDITQYSIGEECDDGDVIPGDGCDEYCQLECRDVDEDGFGLGRTVEDRQGCTYPELEDCDDSNADVNPAMAEICNGIDDDCDPGNADGMYEEWYYQPTTCGVGECVGNTGVFDCVEATQVNTCDAFAGAIPESCEDETGYDGLDNNCDGTIDLNCEVYCDQDGDGYSPHVICIFAGYSIGDCDDTDSSINPGATDVACDGIDQDCSGADFPGTDNDNDGYFVEGGYCGVIDCDDADSITYPGAPEVCDNKDNDCDGLIDENVDLDNDGVEDCATDLCLGTVVDPILESELRPNNHIFSESWIINIGSKNSPEIAPSRYTIVDTFGCSCMQILECKPGVNNGELLHGCSSGTMNVFTNQQGWFGDCFVTGTLIAGESKSWFENTDNGGILDIDALDADNDDDGFTDVEEIEEGRQLDDKEEDGKPDWWCDKHPNKC